MTYHSLRTEILFDSRPELTLVLVVEIGRPDLQPVVIRVPEITGLEAGGLFSRPAETAPMSSFPVETAAITELTAYRIADPLTIDGRLDECAWQSVDRSKRFVDLVDGTRTIHDTRVALLWDDEYLYVGYWVEEPFVEASLSQRDAPIYTDNDVELFIAGPDAYYELEINAFGTIYEVFFVWEEAYQDAGFADIDAFDRSPEGVEAFDGVGYDHPRGERIGYWNWDFPGLEWDVWVDGTINDNSDRDRGWLVEVALPWESMAPIFRGTNRALPPSPGDSWRLDFSRFNQYKEAPPAVDSGGWALSHHGVWDSHVPEVFPFVTFSAEQATERSPQSHNQVGFGRTQWQFDT